MNKIQLRRKLDLADNVLAPGGMVGSRTPKWTQSNEFAIARMRLGASLTVMTDVNGKVLRYTIHHIGRPYKLPRALGERMLTELPLKLCWSVTNLGRINFDGGLMKLYQYEGKEDAG